MRRIVFLDIDGVLNSAEYRDSDRRPERGGVIGLDPLAVARLNAITDRTGADIVVTSTKRIGKRAADMRGLLMRAGVRGVVLGVTPVLPGGQGTRAREIDAWLTTWTRIRGPFAVVVLDDSVADVSSLPHIAARVVGTTWEHGLLDEHVERAVALLEAP